MPATADDPSSAEAAAGSVRNRWPVKIRHRPLPTNSGRMAAFLYDACVPRPNAVIQIESAQSLLGEPVQMSSALGWIEISAAHLRNLRQELQPESDGVRDEMGVGALHSGYADRFFPGTSVLQKRPRYLFFTCWNYLALGSIRLDQALGMEGQKEQAEDWVKRQLLLSSQGAVIGATVDRPAQPVDYIYWSALRKWGFYRGPDRGTILRKWHTHRPQRIERSFSNERENLLPEPSAAFFVDEAPSYWLGQRLRTGQRVTFDLTNAEARFLQARLRSLDACILSTAASLVTQQAATAEHMWDDVLVRAAAERRKDLAAVDRARLASSLALAIRAIYGALVEQRRNATISKAQLSQIDEPDYYREQLRATLGPATDVRVDVKALDLKQLSDDLPRLNQGLVALFTWVQARVSDIRKTEDVDRLLLDDEMMRRFTQKEWDRKKLRARLPATEIGAERRKDFDVRTVTLAGVHYRWDTLKMLFQDLRAGLLRRESQK